MQGRDVLVLIVIVVITAWLVPTKDRLDTIKDQSEQRITRLESIGK